MARPASEIVEAIRRQRQEILDTAAEYAWMKIEEDNGVPVFVTWNPARITIDLNDDGSITTNGCGGAAEWCARHGKSVRIMLHNGDSEPARVLQEGHPFPDPVIMLPPFGAI